MNTSFWCQSYLMIFLSLGVLTGEGLYASSPNSSAPQEVRKSYRLLTDFTENPHKTVSAVLHATSTSLPGAGLLSLATQTLPLLPPKHQVDLAGALHMHVVGGFGRHTLDMDSRERLHTYLKSILKPASQK